MMLTRRDTIGLLVTGAGGLAVGCSRLTKPTPLDVVMTADPGINPNEDGEPSPIVVRVYELKGLTAFNNATFFELADDDVKTLGADLLASQEYELTPGEEKKYDREINGEATHIGVVGGFRDIQNAQWRDSIELTPGKKNEFAIYVTSLSVKVEKLRKRLGIF